VTVEGECGVDRLSSLFGALVTYLHGVVNPDICPGNWTLAVAALGVGVGLSPTVGVLVIAVLRRRVGSRYGVGGSSLMIAAGLLTAGLVPLLAFVATGRWFTSASGANAYVPYNIGDEPACDYIPEIKDLAGSTVRAAFDPDAPLRFGYALVLLALVPLISSMFVAAQARLVLRRGPSWPSKFFWLPWLAVAVLTAQVPFTVAGLLWVGAAAGSFVGIFVALLAGRPSREKVRSSLAARDAPPGGGGARVAAPQRSAIPPGTARLDAAGPDDAQPKLSERLAGRFAEREASPLVTTAAGAAALAPGPQAPVGPPDARAAAASGGPAPTRVSPTASPFLSPSAPPTPTMVAPAAPFSVARPGSGTRFRVIRRLGSGGFGRVWLAHDARFGHVVALKAAHAPDAETEQRIRREARALATVRHPHCVRIHDLVPAASDPGLSDMDGMVIVMGYVEGASLGELVRDRGLVDDLAAARMWTNVAGALDAAHRQGVLHRDVKPGNVVVDTGGLAHLIDFGIARTTGDATMTLAGFVLGTPDYLAPEVACGERATPASDAWQLAATVSYALTGHPPRGGHVDAVSGLRAAACGAALSHLPRRSAHLALLHAAMDNDPARRPPLPVVQRALEEWLRHAGTRSDGPVTAGPPAR